MTSPSGKPFTVSELSALVRTRLETAFGIVEVEGEITDFKGPNAAGHCYFSLKDATARISVVLFAGAAARLGMRIENGKKARATGRLTAYAGTSRYQIVASSLVDTGIGDLAVKFEEMKRRLAAEGLFDDAHKKTLPLLPRHIGLVTSTTGAVIRDFVNVLSRRYPNVDLLIAQARVQGEGAAEEIARGVRDLNKVGHAGSALLESLPPREVIVVMRGGGSMEELWCFNEEVVARAVFESQVPVISAVGHQTDFTICDFVADKRAPTPSAAAEIILRPKADFEGDLARLAQRMGALADTALASVKTRLVAVEKNRVFAEPSHAVENYTQHLDALAQAMATALDEARHKKHERFAAAEARLALARADKIPAIRAKLDALLLRARHAIEKGVEIRRGKIDAATRQLSALNPLAVLDRGYSLTFLADGRALRTPADAPAGTRLTTRLAHGAEVKSVVENGAASPVPKKPKAKRQHTPDAQLFDFMLAEDP